MIYEYGDKIQELLKVAEERNKDVIDLLAKKVAENIENDKVIHTFGTGHSHMLGIELFARAGGLGNVDAMLDPDTLTSFGAQRSGAMEKTPGVSDVIYDSYNIEQGDMMIITSNSGRNAMPIEMAMRCGDGTLTLAGGVSSAAGGVRVEGNLTLVPSDWTNDVVLSVKDNVTIAPAGDWTFGGDATLDLDGIKTGPASSIVTMFLVNTIVSEAIKIVLSHGKRPYVFQSQNVDGFDNNAIYEHFKGRVKHF